MYVKHIIQRPLQREVMEICVFKWRVLPVRYLQYYSMQIPEGLPTTLKCSLNLPLVIVFKLYFSKTET